MEPPWDKGKKVCSNGPGHMTKMIPYMVKTLKILLLWNQKADYLESWYAASGTGVLPKLFNDDPGLTLTDLKTRSKFVSCFCIRKW